VLFVKGVGGGGGGVEMKGLFSCVDALFLAKKMNLVKRIVSCLVSATPFLIEKLASPEINNDFRQTDRVS
jgi:hypothetical protein